MLMSCDRGRQLKLTPSSPLGYCAEHRDAGLFIRAMWQQFPKNISWYEPVLTMWLAKPGWVILHMKGTWRPRGTTLDTHSDGSDFDIWSPFDTATENNILRTWNTPAYSFLISELTLSCRSISTNISRWSRHWGENSFRPQKWVLCPCLGRSEHAVA